MVNSKKFWQFIEHPRTAFIGAIVLGAASHFVSNVLEIVLLCLAGTLILLSAWEWSPIRDRIPLSFQSPVVLTNRRPRVVPDAPELGMLDFEIRALNATQAIAKQVEKMGTEMSDSGKKIEREGVKVVESTGKSAQVREKAINSGARVIEKHARRMSRLEAQYRVSVQEMTTNTRRWIETQSGADISVLRDAISSFKTVAETNRDSTAEYQLTAINNRALNINQTMNGAFENLSRVLGRIIEDASMLIDFCNWVEAQ